MILLPDPAPLSTLTPLLLSWSLVGDTWPLSVALARAVSQQCKPLNQTKFRLMRAQGSKNFIEILAIFSLQGPFTKFYSPSPALKLPRGRNSSRDITLIFSISEKECARPQMASETSEFQAMDVPELSLRARPGGNQTAACAYDFTLQYQV